jgi:excisionase family DNA binding protein
MTNDRWLTTTEIATALHVSRQTVSRWIREGRLKAVAIEVGTRPIYRIRESDFRRFVQAYIRNFD